MERMPWRAARAGLSSTFTLARLTVPLESVASSSRAGAMARQGAHHSAQKSTIRISLCLPTSASKVASSRCRVASDIWLRSPLVGLPAGARAIEISDHPVTRQVLAAESEGEGEPQTCSAQDDDEGPANQLGRDAELTEGDGHGERDDGIARERRQHIGLGP